jgi:hypothetical protein
MSEILELQELRRYDFGLVDPAMSEHLPNALGVDVLVPPNLASCAHLMPRFVRFRNIPDDQLCELLENLKDARDRGQAPPLTVLVKANVGSNEFARHWNSMQMAARQAKRQLWLRLHDPRVLHQLLRILSPAQYRNFFSRFDMLTYWIGEQWVTVPAVGKIRPATCIAERDDAFDFGGPARWDWNRIEQIGIVNRALLGAGVRQPAALTSQGGCAENLIQRAISLYGLVSVADLVEFAIRGLTISARFDEHPAIARALKLANDDESSLADRLALIDERVWDQLGRPDKL